MILSEKPISNLLELSTMATIISSLKFFDESSQDTDLDCLQKFRCVGSCNGWLAFLDDYGGPLILNPFSKSQIYVPPKKTLPRLSRATKILKIVVSSHAAVAMYNLGQANIAFFKHGDKEWTDLDGQGEEYYDVVCCQGTHTFLALGPGPTVESWDLTEAIPKKTMIIQNCCPRKLLLDRRIFPADLYSTNWYLAVSPLGQMFMIVRYIGEFVRYNGEVVCEGGGETLTEICPYKTVDFRVFRLDDDRREWLDVETLNDFSLFLGVNQSMMVSCGEWKKNAIYFTDDYWERIDEDYSYGGHDLGVFTMEDRSIELLVDIDDYEQQKIDPPPFWIGTN